MTIVYVIYCCGLVCVWRMQALDMPTAVRYLSESEAALQILGAAYIQHQCYHSSSAKNQVLVIFKPVTLFICCVTFLHQKHLFFVSVPKTIVMVSLWLRSELCKEFQLWLSFSPVITDLSNVMPPAPPGTLFMKMPKTRWHWWMRAESCVLSVS